VPLVQRSVSQGTAGLRNSTASSSNRKKSPPTASVSASASTTTTASATRTTTMMMALMGPGLLRKMKTCHHHHHFLLLLVVAVTTILLMVGTCHAAKQPTTTTATDQATCQSSSSLIPPNKNTALVFVKPHANTQGVRDLVVDQLTQAGIEILSQVDIDGEEIERRKLIDNHYYSIASKATLLHPKDMNVPPDKFYDAFGEDWETVLRDNRACNALEACQRFDVTPSELNEMWTAASPHVVKFGGGFYCVPLSFPSSSDPMDLEHVYVFNGFFMSMRSKFVGPDKEIRCYVVQWDPSVLSWKQFRGHILGPTDPVNAPIGSIRRSIFDQWKQLGLEDVPNNSDNGVHASASPLEGLAERINFLGLQMQDDEFATYLLDSGLTETTILSWTKDPQVLLSDDDENGGQQKQPEGAAGGTVSGATTRKYGSIFDELEDLDVTDCAKRMIELSRLNSAKTV
jgi:hypothetical protein